MKSSFCFCSQASAILLIALISISINVCAVGSFDFSCESLSTPKCFCESKSGGGQHGLELLCPNSPLAEVHDVTLTLNSGQYDPSASDDGSPLSNSTASSNHAGDFNLIQVTVKCNPYMPERELQSELLKGLNLEGASAEGKYWYKLKVSLCPILTKESLDHFLVSISLPKDRLIGFSFEPPQYKDSGLLITNTSLIFSFVSTLTQLETLELRRNNIVRLPERALAPLTRLQELHLKENLLVFLNTSDFEGNTRLKLLDLSSNSIQSLHDVRFPSGSLELLDLSNNRLQEIEETTFGGLGRLRVLTLRKNTQLKLIHYKAFDQLTNLATLDLVYTAFDALPRLDGLQSLQNLLISYLDNNPTIFLAHSQTRVNTNTTLYSNTSSSGSSNSGNGNELSTVFKANPATAFAGLAPSMQTLQLISDGLLRVPAFGTGLKNLSILNLSANLITILPADAFVQLPALTQLDLSLNQIVTLDGVRLGGVPNLKSLTMSDNFVTRLGRGLFKGLGRLETLRMSNNLIDEIDARAFEYLTSLLELDLSGNKLKHLTPVSAPITSGNNPQFSNGTVEDSEPSEHAEAAFLLDSGFQQSYFRFCTKLQTLNLARNRIPAIYDDWKNLFLRLRSLDLSFNGLTELHVNDINFLSIATTLSIDLRFNNISTVDMDHAALFLEESSDKRNTAVQMNGNPLDCDCRTLAFHRFSLKGVHFDTSDLRCAMPPALAGNLFKSVSPQELICPYQQAANGHGAGTGTGVDGGCPSICECWRVPINQTIVVNCSFRQLKNFVPDVTSVRIPRGYKVVLNLAGNGYTMLNASHAQNVSSSVVRIDLSQNELESLGFLKVLITAVDDANAGGEAPSTTTPVSASSGMGQNQNLSVTLARNRFSCEDCELHRLVKTYFRQISDYNELTCISGANSGNGSVVRHVLSSEQLALETEYCSYLYDNGLSSSMLVLAVIAGLLFAFTALLLVVYLRHGWAIRAFLYSKGFGACLFIADEEEEYEKVYDAFVSYSHKDEAWVISQLVNRLEEEEGFKLCLHYRDWTPGDWIPDQIVQSVDKSRRTVIILSKNFVESIWSRLEFKAAHSQALNEKTNRLILILIGDDLSEADIYDDDLRVYMKMNTYLKWSDPWLWHKLKFALPHKKKSPSGAQGHGHTQVQHERAIQLDKLRSKMEKQAVRIQAQTQEQVT